MGSAQGDKMVVTYADKADVTTHSMGNKKQIWIVDRVFNYNNESVKVYFPGKDYEFTTNQFVQEPMPRFTGKGESDEFAPTEMIALERVAAGTPYYLGFPMLGGTDQEIKDRVEFDTETCTICEMHGNMLGYESMTGIALAANISIAFNVKVTPTVLYPNVPEYYQGLTVGGGAFSLPEEFAEFLFGSINGFIGLIGLIGVVFIILTIICCLCGAITCACGMKKRKTAVSPA